MFEIPCLHHYLLAFLHLEILYQDWQPLINYTDNIAQVIEYFMNMSLGLSVSLAQTSVSSEIFLYCDIVFKKSESAIYGCSRTWIHFINVFLAANLKKYMNM